VSSYPIVPFQPEREAPGELTLILLGRKRDVTSGLSAVT
jgi:hypothetical protein